MVKSPLAACLSAYAATLFVAFSSGTVAAQTGVVPRVTLEINTAAEADLDSLRGLGPTNTRRILAARQDGPFVDWADLQRRVKGIGPNQARHLCEQGLRVAGGGQACGATP